MLRMDESTSAWMPGSGTWTRPNGSGAFSQYATARSRQASACSTVAGSTTIAPPPL